MEKAANYVISGIYCDDSNGSKIITHVHLHEVLDDNKIAPGKKRPESDIIEIIAQGMSVKTVTWNYINGSFDVGADVNIYSASSQKFLRTYKDGTVTDNLDNLINMGWLSGK